MSNGVTINTINNGASVLIAGLGGGSSSGSSFAHISEASGNVYIDSSLNISGFIDANSLSANQLYPKSTYYSLDTPSYTDVHIEYFNNGSDYQAIGYTFIFSIYPYRNIHGTRLYSLSGLNVTLIDDNSNNPIMFTGHWNPVSGADGYRVVIVQDPQAGVTNSNFYFDTPYSGFIIGGYNVAFDDLSSQGYTFNAKPITSPSGSFIFTGLFLDGNLFVNGVISNDSGDLNLISTTNINISGVTKFIYGDSYRLDSSGNASFYHTIEGNAYLINDRLTQFGNVLDVDAYTGSFNGTNNFAGGIPLYRMNGATNYLGGDNRGYAEVALLYGLNGTKGTIMEFLPRRDASYSSPEQNGVFMHPLKLDGYGHIYMGNNPESEHTLWFPAPHWVTIRPSTTDSAQLFLMGGQLTTGIFNGAIQSDGTGIYTTQAGITSRIATYADLSGILRPNIVRTTGTSTYTGTLSGTTILISGQKTVILPNVSNANGYIYNIKQIAVATGTISGSAGALIDGSLNYSLTGRYNTVTVQSDGSSWWILSKI